MHECRNCCKMFQPTAHQIKKHDWLCLPCRRIADTAWRASRKVAGKPVQSTKMPRSYHAAYERRYFSDPSNRKRAAENQQRYRRDPELRSRHAARWLLNRAIASGKIKRQPCEICGKSKTDAHHDDYTKPLKVRWLCRTHHAQHHAKAEGR